MKVTYYVTHDKNRGWHYKDRLFDNLESAIAAATEMLEFGDKIHVMAQRYTQNFHLFTVTRESDD
jgi:hypothetical protein